MPESPQRDLQERLDGIRPRLDAVRRQVHHVVIGLDPLIDGMLSALVCGGHVLLEGVPGLAKTLCATTLAGALAVDFGRVQFTPDLLPGDLLGAEVYSPQTGEFFVRRGPIFVNLLLADEVNRAPAKVQSALLEAMQEHQVTLAGRTLPLPDPFMVVATENPVEQEGTYPLPEAQVDRFLLKLKVPYPEREAEREIVERMATSRPPSSARAVLEKSDIAEARAVADRIYVDARARNYAVDLVRATRETGSDLRSLVAWGASPRAAVHLVMVARARALMAGRAHVLPDDVQAAAPDVLRHRLILTFEAEAEGVRPDEVIGRVLETVPVP
ncbi:MAG: MoxR family ATPase [Candidatus Brocadiaceae bacterium]|nr:MoxR family ATPase [Candidatus Brocadiaceae bacterium]